VHLQKKDGCDTTLKAGLFSGLQIVFYGREPSWT
jgi:hypothetical protein